MCKLTRYVIVFVVGISAAQVLLSLDLLGGSTGAISTEHWSYKLIAPVPLLLLTLLLISVFMLYYREFRNVVIRAVLVLIFG